MTACACWRLDAPSVGMVMRMESSHGARAWVGTEHRWVARRTPRPSTLHLDTVGQLVGSDCQPVRSFCFCPHHASTPEPMQEPIGPKVLGLSRLAHIGGLKWLPRHLLL